MQTAIANAQYTGLETINKVMIMASKWAIWVNEVLLDSGYFATIGTDYAHIGIKTTGGLYYKKYPLGEDYE